MSSRDIFDEISFKSDGDIFDSLSIEEKKTSPIARKAKVGAKALASGAGGAYGDILDLFGLQAKETLPGEKAQRDVEFEILDKMEKEGYNPSWGDILALSDDDDIAPRYSRLPSTKDMRKILQADEPKDLPERWLQRAGEAVGGGAALGGGAKTLLALLAGATAGEGAKELGFPEPVADVIDIGTTLIAGKRPNKGLSKKGKDKLISSLKSKGFSDKEITPLLQDEKKLRRLGKIAKADPKTEKTLKEIKDKLGSLYENVKEEGGKLKGLNMDQYDSFQDSLKETLDKIRPGYRRLIKDELSDLSNSEHSIKDLIDFYQDINMKVKGVEGGKAVLNKLKGPVLDAISEISPKAAEDFKLTNELYSKLSKVKYALKPSRFDELYSLGKIYGLGAGLATGNLGALKKVLSYGAARKLATQMLVNPKLQGLSSKIGAQIKQGKNAGIRNATLKLLKYLKAEDKDLFEEMNGEKIMKESSINPKNKNKNSD